MKNVFSKRSLVLFALMVSIFTIAAAAQVSQKVLRDNVPGETHVGRCCKVWDAAINVVEPQDKLVPIVVTFSMDYRATAPFYIGVRINDGVCAFNGPSHVATFAPEDETSMTSATYQWVILPGDYKLRKGTNVVTVCGGGVDFFAENDTIILGMKTLSAQTVK